MKITLIRHGRSKHIDNSKMTIDEFSQWVRKYDDSGIFEEDSYPLETIERIETANIVITSDLKRSIESAKLLNPNIMAICSPLFRETELPIPTAKLWGIRLNPIIWAVILRCLWFIGYSSRSESLGCAKQRAQEAAKVLAEYAQVHKAVAFVGHGFINQLIGKELQKMGWVGNGITNSHHWGCTIYSLHS